LKKRKDAHDNYDTILIECNAIGYDTITKLVAEKREKQGEGNVVQFILSFD